MKKTIAEKRRGWGWGMMEGLVLTSRMGKRMKAKMLERVGEYLGGGADGVVFEYGPTRVIKFCTREFEKGRFGRIKEVESKVRGRRYVVRVYEMKRLGRDSYYMVMERLKPLREVDVDLFYRVRWRAIPGLKEMGEGLRELKVEEGLHFGDLHSGNLMRKGKFWKVIDIDGFLYPCHNRFYEGMNPPVVPVG